ncbi:MAG TPA: hypothetical protein VGO11_21430 [Chthoniobacteraceae bacterium]|jgi:hypothetical protein|nr:hypothetical protein [Chthoniobacteraceae bacterium]
MKTSGVIANPHDEDLESIYRNAVRDSRSFHPAPEKALVGDLVLLLAAPILYWQERHDLANYGGALDALAQGSRWQQLRKELATRVHHDKGERRAVAVRYLAETMARRLTEFTSQHLEDAQDEQDEKDEKGDSEENDPVKIARLEQLGVSYLRESKEERDRSEPVANDHALLMSAFAQRGYAYHFLTSTLSVALMDLCLATRWDEEDYEARRLEIVHLEGEVEDRLRGDLNGARGVDVKTREEQLPKVLSSELAPYFHSPAARAVTVDKIVNRSPLITEHHHPTRPLSRHRVLVTLIAAPERSDVYFRGIDAETRARQAVFHLLFALVQKVPRDQVIVDVGVFIKAEGGWAGASFALDAVQPRDEAWRNILVLDDLQPLYFAQFSGRHGRRRQVERFSSDPGDWIARTTARVHYRGVLLAAFGRAHERRNFLPSTALALPRMDAETPLVLLGTCEDEALDLPAEQADDLRPAEQRAARRAAQHRQASTWNGKTFPNLLSAHMAPLPLPRTTLPQLSDQFLAMVIGPRRERAAVRTF